jgi:hypothetical protein
MIQEKLDQLRLVCLPRWILLPQVVKLQAVQLPAALRVVPQAVEPQVAVLRVVVPQVAELPVAVLRVVVPQVAEPQVDLLAVQLQVVEPQMAQATQPQAVLLVEKLRVVLQAAELPVEGLQVERHLRRQLVEKVHYSQKCLQKWSDSKPSWVATDLYQSHN